MSSAQRGGAVSRSNAPRQARKKEKIFEDESKSPIKRLKALYDYINLTDSLNAISLFFYRRYEKVFDVIYKTFVPTEEGSKKKKNRGLSISDATLAFEVFDIFMDYSRGNLQIGWNKEKILGLFSTLCSRQNKKVIHDKGISLLCKYVDILQDSVDQSVINFVRNVFDLSPFIDDFTKTVILSSNPINTPIPGVEEKEKVGGSKETVLQNLEYLLTFITEKATNKSFWIRLFVVSILPNAYPVVCAQKGIIENDPKVGFRDRCPYELQELFTRYVVKWFEFTMDSGNGKDNTSTQMGRAEVSSRTVALRNLLLDELRDILFEVFKQSFQLPSEYEKSVDEVLNLYKRWLQRKASRTAIVRDNFDLFLEYFIDHSEYAFLKSPEHVDPERHAERIVKVLDFVKIITSQRQDYIPQRLWKRLFDFTATTMYFVSTSYPAPVKDLVFPILAGSSLAIWIGSRMPNRNMWDEAGRIAKYLRDDIAMCIQWKRAIVQFSLQNHHHLFNLSAYVGKSLLNPESKFLTSKEEEQLSPPNPIPMEYWEENTRNTPTFPFPHKQEVYSQYAGLEKDIPLVRLDDSPWTAEATLFIWSKLFRLLGNPNNIQDPHVYSYVMSAYIEIFNLLKIVEKKLFKVANISVQTFFPFWNLFTPIFFEGALVDERRKDGRALCFKILCQMFSRRHRRMLSDEMLSRFYYTLTVGLNYKDKLVTQIILRYTSQLFGYSYPGINGLINPYIKGIEALLESSESKYLLPGEYIDAITILSQFISIQDHFYGVEMYDYSKLLSVDPDNVNIFIEIQKTFNQEIETREQAALGIVSAIENNFGAEQILQLINQEYQRQATMAATSESLKLLKNLYLFDTETIRISIATMISKYLYRTEPKDSSVIKYSMWLMSSILLVELERGEHSNVDIVKIVLDIMFKYVTHENAEVSSAAATSLSNISSRKVIYTVSKKECEDLIMKSANIVINSLSRAVVKHEHPPKYLHTILQFIISWVAKIPKLLSSKSLVEKIFYMVFASLNLVISKLPDKKVGINTFESILIAGLKKKKDSQEAAKTLGEMLFQTKKLYREFELKNSGKDIEYDPPLNTHPCIALMNNAEILYYYLNTAINNYPRFGDRHDHTNSIFDPDVVDIPPEYLRIKSGYLTAEEEKELSLDVYSRTYALDNSTIITLYELVKPGVGRNPVVRVIVRDVSGKYVWDVEFLTSLETPSKQEEDKGAAVEVVPESSKKVAETSSLEDSRSASPATPSTDSTKKVTTKLDVGRTAVRGAGSAFAKASSRVVGNSQASSPKKVDSSAPQENPRKKAGIKPSSSSPKKFGNSFSKPSSRSGSGASPAGAGRTSGFSKTGRFGTSKGSVAARARMFSASTNTTASPRFKKPTSKPPTPASKRGSVSSIAKKFGSSAASGSSKGGTISPRFKKPTTKPPAPAAKRKSVSSIAERFNSNSGFGNKGGSTSSRTTRAVGGNTVSTESKRKSPSQISKKFGSGVSSAGTRNPGSSASGSMQRASGTSPRFNKPKSKPPQPGLRRGFSSAMFNKPKSKPPQPKARRAFESPTKSSSKAFASAAFGRSGQSSGKATATSESKSKENSGVPMFRRANSPSPVQDSTGKPMFGRSDALSASLGGSSSLSGSDISKKIEEDSGKKDTPVFKRKKKEIPRYDPKITMGDVDMLAEVLSYLRESVGSEVDNSMSNSKKHKGEEEALNNSKVFMMAEQKILEKTSKSHDHLLNILRETQQNIPIHRVQYVRTLLAALGLIHPEQTERLVPLVRLNRATRTLSQIDKRATRELQKIGVVYLSLGQSDQKQILHNDRASPLFEEFVDSLGWNVDIRAHKGYMGGLDKYTYVNGKTFPYYSEFDLEVVFHVVPRMPNSKTDSQQIHKKKHVGNDNIHIVWSEDTEEYKKETITSQFNFAHIVIYPLPNGMFRIQILCKEGVELFGPCISGMILDKKSLGFMVRETAITANKTVRYKQRGYKHPLPTRWDIIYETIKRHSESLDYESYFGDLFYLEEGVLE